MGSRYKVTFQPLTLDRRETAFDGYFDLTDALEDAGFDIEEESQNDVRYDYSRCSARWIVSHPESQHVKPRLREIFTRFDIESIRITELYFR